MKFGVCCSPENVHYASAFGFDYFEWYVQDFLCPFKGVDTFKESLARVKSVPLPCSAVNCFLPGDLKITGPAVDIGRVRKYATTAFERAGEAGVEVIVFGSSGARQVPDGFDRKIAYKQIVEFCRMIAPIAERNSVEVVVEPLNGKECNVLNTLAECAELVKEVDHPNIMLLVDGYQWGVENDSVDDINTYGSLLKHAHVATVPNRLSPGLEESNTDIFLRALGASGYNARISIEGKIPNPETDLPKALALMKSLL